MTLDISAFREWMTPLAWGIAGGLLLLGLLLPLLLRRPLARLRFTAGVIATWLTFYLLAHLPTPRWLQGDGYAVTTAIGAMGSLYTLPFVIGAVLSYMLIFLVKAICRVCFMKRRSPPR